MKPEYIMKDTWLLTAFLVAAAFLLLLNSCSGEKKEAIRIGDTVTTFSAPDLNGKNISLNSLRGSPVILRFFLVDCPYCRADTPVFNEFYKDYRSKGLEIVYINNDAKNVAEVVDFTRELNIDFPVIYDPKGKIARQYNVRLQPLTLVLSPEQKLLGALLGGVSEAELKELLKQYL